MRFQCVAWCCAMAGLLASCVSTSTTPSTATPMPTLAAATTTNTISPTSMPSVTSTPSATPFPPLASTGPYLILKQQYYANELLIYDKDGHGRRILTLPNGCFVRSWTLKQAISSDGKWLVCYTGSIRSADLPISLPLTLHIVNIADGTSRKVADIVTEGYQEKLLKVSDELQKLFPERYKPREGDNWAFGSILMAFEGDIFAQSWSPDNHQLAFAGQIDGNSSDVYIYDIETGVIKRVEDSLQNISSIHWSPTGEYIVFQNSWPDIIYTPTSFHAVKVGGKVVTEPKSLATWWFGGVIDWLSPTIALATDGTDTAGATDLQAIDISTGKLKHLWKDLYGECVVDHEKRLIALISSEFTKEENRGFYFLTFDGKRKKIVDGWYFSLIFRGGDENQFRAFRFSDPQGKVGISLDGTVNELTLPGGNTSVSPDRSWMVIYDEKSFLLYNKSDVLVKSFSAPHFEKIIWRPDAQGFFYDAWDTNSYLAYLPVPSGEPVTIDRCLTENCSFRLDTDAAWLP